MGAANRVVGPARQPGAQWPPINWLMARQSQHIVSVVKLNS
jgi:hypothetical protein